MFHSRQNAACVKSDEWNTSINSRRSSSVYEARPCTMLSFVSMPEKVSGFDRVAYGVQEETHTGKWVDLRDQGKAGKIADLAGGKKARNGKRRTVAAREIEYIRHNARRMRHDLFRGQGLFIGSGVVEAGCKTVVGKRPKQSGMFWKIKGAQNILDIRGAVLSETYGAYREWRQAGALKIAA